MSAPIASAILRIVLPYVFFAGLWILLSDKALETVVTDPATFAQLSIYKGWAFVLVTALLLAILLRGELRKRERTLTELECRVAERTRELGEREAFARALADEQKLLLENIQVGIVFTGDGRILRANPKFAELFGYDDPAQLVGADPAMLFPDADEARRFLGTVRPKLAAGEAVDVEWDGARRDGSRFFGHTIARAIAVPGYTLAAIWMVEDVTEERAAAEALLEAKHAAEAADRLKSAFLATMSHELRTPLNSIIGFTGLVLQELPGPLNVEQKKQLGMVRDSSRHLLALINDVLDISKIEAGELRVAAEPFDLAASITRVADIVRPLAEKKGLVLSVNVTGDIGAMTGDARRVEQILLNLLGNAVKFTESGEVTLDAARVAAFRLEAAAAPVPAVRLSVADTGMGIKPEDMALLFTPFRQIDSALSRNHEGTGLGLAICRRLAALMGGIIEAESQWGEGSVFAVTLPLNPHADREPS